MANKNHFFVDANKYETEKETLTGAEIKQMVPGLNPNYQLFLESHGNDPDKLVSDGEAVALAAGPGGVKKFYTVPPATFGAK